MKNLSIWISLLFFLVILFISYLHLHRTKSKPRDIHGFRQYPILGSLPAFLAHRHRFLDWTTDVLTASPSNTAVFFRPGKVNEIITASPDVVEHVLKTNFDNYPKGARFISLLEDFLGTGIFNADGELWKLQRKTASFEFSKRSLRNFVLECVRCEIQIRLMPLLESTSDSGQVIDLQDVLERFSFDNVCKLAFNLDPGCLSGDGSGQSEFMRAFEDATNFSAGRFMYALPVLCKIKKFLDIGSERKLRESIKTVHEFADKIIRQRLQEKSKNYDEDLLSRFIDTEESSPEFLRDIVISFILAGRDSTSSGLSWFFWLLSKNSDVVSKIRSELRTIRVNNGKRLGDPYDFEELREMHYLQGALSEAMRLYPPVPVNSKACLDDDVLPDGTEVKRGWYVTYDTYAMGRMEAIWGKDCRRFLPERWMVAGKYMPENQFRYPVFHGGPRVCLGKEMAYIQMKSIAASLIEGFEMEVLGREREPEHLLSLTLRMKDGLHVRVQARD